MLFPSTLTLTLLTLLSTFAIAAPIANTDLVEKRALVDAATLAAISKIQAQTAATVASTLASSAAAISSLLKA